MKNSDYWKKRFEQLEQSQNAIGASSLSAIEKQYKEAQKQIEGQIARWYQRFADNNNISMAEARQWLSGSDLKEFKWDVQDYIKYGQENALDGLWMKELENASAKFHISKMEALKIQTQQSLETMFSKQLGTVTSTLGDVFQSGYYHTAYELQKGFGIGWDIAGLDQSQIEKILSKPWAVDGLNFSNRIWNNREKLIDTVHTELAQNIMLGADPQKAIDNIAKKMNTSKKNAGRLVMTEEAYFSSAAQKDCFHELSVEQYEIVATLDSHTSDICRDLDGKVFDMKDFQPGVTAPPFHVWCRSTTAPYFEDDFGEPGERAARDFDGETYYVSGDTTYKEWEKAFVDGDKSGLQQIPDIKFATKNDSPITAKQKFEDTLTVSNAYTELPIKVKQNLNDTIFEFGYDGSACDIMNKTIRVAMGATKEEVFHEYGHLIENYMMHSADVQKYKEYLVDGLSYSDIIVKTYYDTAGNGVDIFLLKGRRFESEYQSRLYVSKASEALNHDGTINVDVLGEIMSEPFRKYMMGEDIADEVKKLIEGVIL